MSKEITYPNNDFKSIIEIINAARQNALKAVNTELIKMYWNVGEYISALCERSSFGDKIIDEEAKYIKETSPEIKGFNRRGLYRMK